ncbi:MAG: helix-turn-helix domain-containing protein [Dehalococcoidia bacterium]|nr:helix-turn-helix domain-containing protein [Dehalococcoidia bacterium]
MSKAQIVLTSEQCVELERFSTTGVRSTRLVNRAKIILMLNTSNGRKAMRQAEIARHLGISRQTVNNVRADFLAAKSLSIFLQRKKRETPPVKPKVTGEIEARIIALACGEVPPGYAHWTLRLLADKCVQLCYVGTLSHMTVSRLLKKHNLSLT